MDNMQAKDVLSLAIGRLSFPASYAEGEDGTQKHTTLACSQKTLGRKKRETKNAHHCPGPCKNVSKSLKNKQQHLTS